MWHQHQSLTSVPSTSRCSIKWRCANDLLVVAVVGLVVVLYGRRYTLWFIKTWQYICDYNSGKFWWILIIFIYLKTGMNTLCKWAIYVYIYLTCDVNNDVTMTFMTLMSCDSVCCMYGEASSSRWLMMQFTNGKYACVLVFMPVVDILNIPCDCQFALSVLDIYVSHRARCSVGNILRVHYKSIKCDVSFSQGSMSTLFTWGEHRV